MRSYEDTLSCLHGLQRFGVRLGLVNIRALLRLLGNPERNLHFIHIAGTNGKGSVAAMLSSIFHAAGYRTGLYTSPHLVSFCERIQIDGTPLAADDVVQVVGKIRPLADRVATETGAHPTFFEFVTAMAAEYFRERHADIVIWETGLGGRLDATNVVTPLVSVITNVAHDHMETLGDALESIAVEKCGIIKPGVPVVTAANGKALAIIRQHCLAANAPLIEAKNDPRFCVPLVTQNGRSPLVSALRGDHQMANAALAVLAAEQCPPEFAVTPAAIRDGLAATQWPARFQYIDATATRPALLLDGAHNVAAAEALAAALENYFSGRPLIFILGILRDKDCIGICQTIAPLAGEIYCVRVKNPRAVDSAELLRVCSRRAFTQQVTDAGDFATAWELAETSTFKMKNPVVVVTGSLFLCGEALAHLKIPVFGKIATEELAMSAQ